MYLSLSLYIYIYIHDTYIYIYIYIYICTYIRFPRCCPKAWYVSAGLPAVAAFIDVRAAGTP